MVGVFQRTNLARETHIVGAKRLVAHSYIPEMPLADWPEVLLLPGAALNGESFSALALILAQHGVRAHALSLRGHSPSGGSARFATVAQYLDDIRTTISALNLRNVILIGHSAGGWYVQLYARTHTIAGLALLNSCSAHRAQAASVRAQQRIAHVQPPPSVRALWRTEETFLHPSRVRALLLGEHADEALVNWTLRHVICAESLLLGREQRRMERVGMQPIQTNHVLVLGGEADVLVSPQDAADTAADYGTKATLALLPKGPHNMMQVQPSEVADHLMRFCQVCAND